MDFLPHLALTLHIVAFGVWLGNLFAIAVTLTFRNDQADSTIRTQLGALTKLKGRAADIGATLVILTGAWQISFAPKYYLRQPWLHTKLTLVVVLLGIHGFLRMRGKRASEGDAARFPSPIIGFMTALAVAIVALVVFKPFMQ